MGSRNLETLQVIKTWAVVFFYFSGQMGMQSSEVRGISTELACKTLASQYNKYHIGEDFAMCYPIVEPNPQMQIIFPEESKVEK